MESGYSDRVIFIINKEGIIHAIDWVGYKNDPDLRKTYDILENL
jgi:hypothetical protein